MFLPLDLKMSFEIELVKTHPKQDNVGVGAGCGGGVVHCLLKHHFCYLESLITKVLSFSLNNFKRERLTQVAKQLLGHPPVPTLPKEEAN